MKRSNKLMRNSGTVELYHATRSGENNENIASLRRGIDSSFSQGFGQGAGFFLWKTKQLALEHGRDMESGKYSKEVNVTGHPVIVTVREELTPEDFDVDYEAAGPDFLKFLEANQAWVTQHSNQIMAKVNSDGLGINIWGEGMTRRSMRFDTDVASVSQAQSLGRLAKRISALEPDVMRRFETLMLDRVEAVKYVGSRLLYPTRVERLDGRLMSNPGTFPASYYAVFKDNDMSAAVEGFSRAKVSDLGPTGQRWAEGQRAFVMATINRINQAISGADKNAPARNDECIADIVAAYANLEFASNVPYAFAKQVGGSRKHEGDFDMPTPGSAAVMEVLIAQSATALSAWLSLTQAIEKVSRTTRMNRRVTDLLDKAIRNKSADQVRAALPGVTAELVNDTNTRKVLVRTILMLKEYSHALVPPGATPCPRCGGVGFLPQFMHIDRGTCYACAGSGVKSNGPSERRNPMAYFQVISGHRGAILAGSERDTILYEGYDGKQAAYYANLADRMGREVIVVVNGEGKSVDDFLRSYRP